ncbi:hypothetical protein ACQJBY_047590 [Aegilops geniculata]
MAQRHSRIWRRAKGRVEPAWTGGRSLSVGRPYTLHLRLRWTTHRWHSSSAPLRPQGSSSGGSVEALVEAALNTTSAMHRTLEYALVLIKCKLHYCQKVYSILQCRNLVKAVVLLSTGK